eukprot:scaffold87182_cov22-Prasinocladus_malaysianus.AAC.2
MAAVQAGMGCIDWSILVADYPLVCGTSGAAEHDQVCQQGRAALRGWLRRFVLGASGAERHHAYAD